MHIQAMRGVTVGYYLRLTEKDIRATLTCAAGSLAHEVTPLPAFSEENQPGEVSPRPRYRSNEGQGNLPCPSVCLGKPISRALARAAVRLPFAFFFRQAQDRPWSGQRDVHGDGGR